MAESGPCLPERSTIMETIPGHDWRPPTDRDPIQPLELAGIELHHLTRYLVVIALVTMCMLISAWSRLDFRETAVALDEAQRAHELSLSEQAQLELELASLSDPHWLNQAAAALQLEAGISVVDLESATR
jgi:hypothetical protein